MEFETTFTGFADRREGGRRLAKALSHYRGRPDTIVLALPRGGVVTAGAIAEDLDLPLDVLVVRKLGTPGHEELAMGAIGAGGVRVLNDEVIRTLQIPPSLIDAATRRESFELARRELRFRGGQPPLQLAGQTVIVVDDGLVYLETPEPFRAVGDCVARAWHRRHGVAGCRIVARASCHPSAWARRRR